MQARDIMTTGVVTVSPNTTVSEVARTLLAHDIGAVPVVDDKGAVVGVVSETDLLRRPETGTVRRRGWLAYFEAPATLAEEYAHVHGNRAEDVMNRDILSVAPDRDLLSVVDLMERRRIRRVLVMEGGELRGVVCRSDLLRGMLASRERAAASESDRAIRTMLLEEVRDQPWRSVTDNNITVADGVVTFWGEAGSDEERKALRVAAENVPGVKRVEDRTTSRPGIAVPLI
ncbi:MAG TPA: CBS domain-containing protein [Propylenella sp.]